MKPLLQLRDRVSIKSELRQVQWLRQDLEDEKNAWKERVEQEVNRGIAEFVVELHESTSKPKAMKPKAHQNAHRGSGFADFLAEEGILPEVEILALKRVVALQLQQILEQECISKTQLAARMKTSRAALDRILDPHNPSLTVASLGKAAAALGRKVELRFVPA
jgi:hypothetical protein